MSFSLISPNSENAFYQQSHLQQYAIYLVQCRRSEINKIRKIRDDYLLFQIPYLSVLSNENETAYFTSLLIATAFTEELCPFSSGLSLTSTDAKKTVHVYMEDNASFGFVCMKIRGVSITIRMR